MIPVGFVSKEKEESSKEDLVEVFITVDTRDADYVSDRSVISAKDISIIAELDIRYSGRGVLKEINEYDYITDRIDIPRNCNYEYGPTLSGLELYYTSQDGTRTEEIEIDYKYWEKDNYKNLIESIVNKVLFIIESYITFMRCILPFIVQIFKTVITFLINNKPTIDIFKTVI